MKYNPLHPHCGPFNSVSVKKPDNLVDRVCWEHDKEYAKLISMGKNPYGLDGLKADRAMLAALPDNFAGMTYGTFIKAKIKINQAWRNYVRSETKSMAKDPKFATIRNKIKNFKLQTQFSKKKMSYNRKRLFAGSYLRPANPYKRYRPSGSKRIYMKRYRPMWKKWSSRRRYYRGRRRLY